jgi:hypothetical protein
MKNGPAMARIHRFVPDASVHLSSHVQDALSACVVRVRGVVSVQTTVDDGAVLVRALPHVTAEQVVSGGRDMCAQRGARPV